MALTKYQEGSLRELSSIAFPLMLSSLSVMMMIFVDRLLLAHYSTSALNAATNATTFGYAIVFGWMALGGIAEVFVAQYNGAQNYSRIGPAVWQSIWLALGSTLFFLPVSLWFGNWVYQGSEYSVMERDYFNTMMLFGPLFPLFSGLTAFWIGRGKTAIVTLLAVGANVLNATLDFILIFGVEGWIPAMGVKGAAIATSLGTVFQALVLLTLFLRRHERMQYSTGHARFDWGQFRQMLRIGIPHAGLLSLEVFCWAAFYATMTLLGKEYITTAAICQSVAILFWFFPEGIFKASAAVAGNMIGAKRPYNVDRLIRAGFKLILGFLVVVLLLIVPFVEFWGAQFLEGGEKMSAQFHQTLALSLTFTAFYLAIEAVRLLFAGVLTAAGDTRFLCIGGSLAVWGLMYLPCYCIVYRGHAPVEMAFAIWIFYAVVTAVIYGMRYRLGSWRSLALT